MRIIAGERRGAQLYAPKGMDTRPTQAMVREALFNILQSDLQGAQVLDLFGGSGALALEALSRGAATAVLVDSDRAAVDCMRRNLQKLRYEARCRLLLCDYQQALRRLGKDGARFDLVFLDPPYRVTDLQPVAQTLRRENLLLPGALLVWERAAGEQTGFEAPYTLLKRRAYGQTVIDLYRFACADDQEDMP